jgi:hypothetical protein
MNIYVSQDTGIGRHAVWQMVTNVSGKPARFSGQKNERSVEKSGLIQEEGTRTGAVGRGRWQYERERNVGGSDGGRKTGRRGIKMQWINTK